MAVHHFATREQLLSFWKRRQGYLLNSFRNCLHETHCSTYRYNPPGMSYTRRGFDTPGDVLEALGREGQNWYPCPVCLPIIKSGDPPAPRPTHSSPAMGTVAPAGRATGGLTTDRGAEAIIETICAFGRSVPRFSTGLNPADDLVFGDPFAFLLACSLDRGTKSEIIWKLPFFLKQHLGHLDPARIAVTSEDAMRSALGSLPVKPRYMGDAVVTILDLSRLVTKGFDGRAEHIWVGQPVSTIKRTLMSVRGVGPGIANMTINLLHRYLGVAFTLDDLRDIDVKPDVHVERVFLRTGLMAGAGASVQTARQLSTSYPATLDLGVWEIGRRWCHAAAPNHEQCALSKVCPRRDAI
jgi:endonuclease III